MSASAATSQPISKRAGFVFRLTDRRPHQAFVSWQPLRCAFCGHTIPPGQLFTRHSTRALRRCHAIVCCECVPYSLRKA